MGSQRLTYWVLIYCGYVPWFSTGTLSAELHYLNHYCVLVYNIGKNAIKTIVNDKQNKVRATQNSSM